MIGSGERGEGPRTFDGAGDLEGVGGDAEDRAEGQEAAVEVGDDRAVEAGERLQHGRIKIDQRLTAHDVMQRALCQAGREIIGILGVVGDDFLGDAVGRRDELGNRLAGSRNTTNSGPLRSSLRFNAAWKIRRARSAWPQARADGIAPGAELGRDVEQPPARASLKANAIAPRAKTLIS